MTAIRAICLLSFLLLAVPTAAKPGAAKSAPSPRREIQAIYNKIDAAARTKDVDGMYAYDADEVTVIDRKGRVHDSSEGRQELADALELIDSVQAATAIQSFTGTATDATVVIKEHYVLKIANNATGRAARFNADDLIREHWTYTENGWRRTRVRYLSGKNALHKNF